MRKPAAGPVAGAPLIWTQPPPPPRQRSPGRAGAPDRVTLKPVPGRLGPYSAMALYRYVHSKEGLVDLMLDAATAEIQLPAHPGPDWRADLEELAAQAREVHRSP